MFQWCKFKHFYSWQNKWLKYLTRNCKHICNGFIFKYLPFWNCTITPTGGSVGRAPTLKLHCINSLSKCLIASDAPSSAVFVTFYFERGTKCVHKVFPNVFSFIRAVCFSHITTLWQDIIRTLLCRQLNNMNINNSEKAKMHKSSWKFDILMENKIVNTGRFSL